MLGAGVQGGRISAPSSWPDAGVMAIGAWPVSWRATKGMAHHVGAPDGAEGRMTMQRDRSEAPATTGSAADLMAAKAVVESFFATFRAPPGERTARLVEGVVQRASKRRALRPDRSLDVLALEEAEADVAAWSFFVLGKERIGDHPPILLARAAYQACGGPERWPEALLDYDLPVECVRAMREAMPVPTPPERPGRMVEQPLRTWEPGRAIRPRIFGRLISAIAATQRS